MQNLDHIMGWIARGFAWAGGAVLLAITFMSVSSITGRALIPLGLSPVKGDFEYLELGVGFVVFSFLPWCQYARGHARVDILERMLGDRLNALLDLVADLLMLAAALLIGWRLWAGMSDKLRYGETTFILQFPLWQAYAACLLPVAAFGLVTLHSCALSTKALTR